MLKIGLKVFNCFLKAIELQNGFEQSNKLIVFIRLCSSLFVVFYN